MDSKAASRRVSTRKRISWGISKANRKTKSLESEKSKLQRKTWMLEKRLQRANKHKAKKRTLTGPEPTAATTAPNTPRSKTNSAIREAEKLVSALEACHPKFASSYCLPKLW